MPIAIPIPSYLTLDQAANFSEFFSRVLHRVHKDHGIDLTQYAVEAGINYFAEEFVSKMLICWRQDNLQRATLVLLMVCNDILYTESLYKYCKDRHKVDLVSGLYKEAIVANIKEFHNEMRSLSQNNASYEDGYQAVRRFMAEYAIHKQAEGSA